MTEDTVTIGGAMIICGDMFEVLKRFDKYPGVKTHFDSTVTSPPFENTDFDCSDDREYYEKYLHLLNTLAFFTRDYSLVFNSSTRLVDICAQFQVYRVLIWDKIRGQTPFRYEPIFVHESKFSRFSFNRSCFCDCYHTPSVDKEKMIHPYENPVELYEKFLLNILTFREGAKFTRRILDPFAGSGSSVIACLNLGLECIAIEKDPRYFDLIVKRVEAWSQGSEEAKPVNQKTVQRISESLAQMKLS